MLNFYLQRGPNNGLKKLLLDRQTCLGLASLCNNSNVLTDDIEHWRDKAKHGDVFKVSADQYVYALDLPTFPFRAKGFYTLGYQAA